MITLPDAREAERISRAERIAAGRWVRVDETKITSPKDLMLLNRVRVAATDQSMALDEMLREPEVNRLFNEGAWFFERPGQ